MENHFYSRFIWLNLPIINQVDRSKKGLVAKGTETAMKIGFIRDYVFKKAREQVMKMSGGLYPAPLRVN